MWQITLYELDEDKVKPVRSYNLSTGWLVKRDCCKNGHAVDWEAIK